MTTSSGLLDYCQGCIARRLFPGCAVAFGTSVAEPALVFAGRLAYRTGSPEVDAETWFDLASLTKPIVTVTAALRAVEEKRLELHTSLPDFFRGILLAQAQVRHLLSHSSGLPAYRPFFQTCKDGEEVIAQILATPAEYPTGTRSVYSDLGFMLLGRLLEMAFNQTLRTVADEVVLEPLGLDQIRFGPLLPLSLEPSSSPARMPAAAESGATRPAGRQTAAGAGYGQVTPEPKPAAGKRPRAATLRALSPVKVAPTELDPQTNKFLHGVVHDDNARLFGGAAGHAGLFGTAGGVARFARQIVATVIGRQRSLLPAEALRVWTRRQSWLPGSSWGLGWDTATPESSAGPALSRSSFGHTGFTGTSIWIDPEQDCYICILSNRVHPSRQTEGMKEVRRQIHALAVEALGV